jgi:F-type H+-transporting ATPase subunit a
VILAAGDILDHVTDHAWPWTISLGGSEIPLMTSGVATMIVVAVALAVALPLLSRRRRTNPAGIGGAMVEVFVLFVRDQIAVPSMGAEKARRYLPMLLTAFVFILALNLSGLFPIAAVTGYLMPHYPIGHTPTSSVAVCGAFALIALLTIVGSGLWYAARHSSLPLPVALLLSPVLWYLRLAPHIPGFTGKVMAVPLAFLELIGVFAKCFSLMVRLFANMFAGHVMLAIIMMFILDTFTSGYATWIDQATENSISFFYVGPICVISSALVDLMELLVAGLQAYIYTFLLAMFLGLYADPEH